MSLYLVLLVLESFASGDSILLIFPDGTGPALLSCLIAGVPLNRVHELNYQQGEVRMDVDYDSVRSFLPPVPSTDYQLALKDGSAQLEILRSKNFVSNKDQAYQTQLQKAEDQEAAWKAKVEKRQEEAEQKRQQRHDEIAAASSTNKSDGPRMVESEDKAGVRAAFGGVLGVTGILAIGSSGGTASSEESNTTAVALEEGAEIQENTIESNAAIPVAEGERKFKELEDMEEKLERAPITIPEFSYPPGDKGIDVSDILQDYEQERLQLAERAMEEYLDQDDGAGSYLNFLGGLMDEDEE